MFAICEEIGGRTVWARRRGWPGPTGLNWHMAAAAGLAPTEWDAGLLTGTREEMQRVLDNLQRARSESGMTASSVLVEIGGVPE
jgi:hypothetical protein